VRVILAGAAAWGARINPHSSGGQPPQLFSEPGEGVKPGAMTAEVAGRPGDRYALLY